VLMKGAKAHGIEAKEILEHDGVLELVRLLDWKACVIVLCLASW
jgi:hypothetical protein